MAITDRNLTAGTVLKARYKGEIFTCKVKEADGNDGLVYTVSGKGVQKQTYPNLHKAAVGVTAPKSCNNPWTFWTREADFVAGNGHKPAKAIKAPKAPKASKKPAAARRKKAPASRRSANPLASKHPFACGECGQDYAEQKEAEACLDSHRAEAAAAQEPQSQVPAGQS